MKNKPFLLNILLCAGVTVTMLVFVLGNTFAPS